MHSAKLKLFIILTTLSISCNPMKPNEKEQTKTTEIVNHPWDAPVTLEGYELKTNGLFISEQKRYERVRGAYQKQGPYLDWLLKKVNIKPHQLQVYFQAFKSEGLFKVWAKNKRDNKYELLKEYQICKRSGKLGPKRKEGDRQVPEGFYHIDRLNPISNFHLSLHINYPNPSDLILSDPIHPGGLIFIHGKCATIGCLPMQDGPIEELYVLCTEAMNNGQETIPVTLFPFIPKEEEIFKRAKQQTESTQKLWQSLKEGHDYFEENRSLPKVRFESDGGCQIH